MLTNYNVTLFENFKAVCIFFKVYHGMIVYKQLVHAIFAINTQGKTSGKQSAVIAQ